MQLLKKLKTTIRTLQILWTTMYTGSKWLRHPSPIQVHKQGIPSWTDISLSTNAECAAIVHASRYLHFDVLLNSYPAFTSTFAAIITNDLALPSTGCASRDLQYPMFS
jgi:hypothetical protein